MMLKRIVFKQKRGPVCCENVILTEKYAGKKMPDRNVCQAPEA